MILIYENQILLSIVSKKNIQRVIQTIELDGINDYIRVLFDEWGLNNLFNQLINNAKIDYPQWYNFGQFDMLNNIVEKIIFELLKNSIHSSLIRYER